MGGWRCLPTDEKHQQIFSSVETFHPLVKMVGAVGSISAKEFPRCGEN
jgi:hypothetical protein